MKHYRLLIIGCIASWLLLATPAFATHNLAGQITYQRIGTNTYEFTLTTYTDSAAAGVDRCFADIEVWGLQAGEYVQIATIIDIPRDNGSIGGCEPPARVGVPLRPRVKRNIYTTTYTLPGPGIFQLRYFDIARVNDVLNMANSGATAFYVETVLNNNPFIGSNDSPQLLNDPIDDACTNFIWSHNPGAYDPDGDSLSFELIPNQQYEPPNFPVPVDVAQYQLPNLAGGGATFEIDPETGIVTWNAATQPGIYNIAIEISEWRNGQRIGYVIRDMAIFVKPCQNDPPVIEVVQDTCVKPGERLEFQVKVYDPIDTVGQDDTLYFMLNNGVGQNGPFNDDIVPSADLQPNLNDVLYPNGELAPPHFAFRWSIQDTFRAFVTWDITCAHVRQEPFQIDYYAHDDLQHFTPPDWAITLAANSATRIRVRPDPIDSIRLTPGSREILVEWSRHTCNTAEGYDIYRSLGSSDVELDTVCCEGGIEGYELIASLDGWETTSYLDDENGAGLSFQDQYCYRVVARFPDGMQSCPSPDSCVRILRDLVIITGDSVGVGNTDENNGGARVSWSPPTALDPVFFPQPWTYELFRDNGNGLQSIANNIAFDDTLFVDAGLNTRTQNVSYQVRLFDASGTEIEGSASEEVSSIFLSSQPRHEAMQLTWTESVPWQNEQYIIFRAGPNPVDSTNGVFYLPIDTIDGTGASTHTYTDTGRFHPNNRLLNDSLYCYFVRSIGTYGIEGIQDPLINDSQYDCGRPQDTVPPCLPDERELFTNFNDDCENFTVTFNFIRPPDSCGFDFTQYRIYYARSIDGSYMLLHETRDSTDLTYVYSAAEIGGGIKGCYRFTVLDNRGNESELSEPVCYDNCPIINLPNVFTPNADGVNDFLIPIYMRSVERARISIFDRHGRAMVDEEIVGQVAENLEFILWDGNSPNGKQAPEGVYFYIVQLTLDNLGSRVLTRSGSVTLLR